ncbi:hypothetical protein RFI_13363 [Reticulomyxa filosa]|uniref:Sugar phosphate transporter domain-containing protein n=1 Tax=Reticulomyxa filosa TaxID=46433 RepID=X6NDH1_RETFI|nr:hypothetical protein RFI_13363 [Reticulomyxa filosa]|eukprot:ETO23814.1 hypothetical protein RFI_13363 [Reticulomyxa filosa]
MNEDPDHANASTESLIGASNVSVPEEEKVALYNDKEEEEEEPTKNKRGLLKSLLGSSQGSFREETHWTISNVFLLVWSIILQTLLPFYNKILFQVYNWPITTSGIQVEKKKKRRKRIREVLFVALVLLIIQYSNIVRICNTRNGMWFVLKSMILPSLCFACSIILTNIGIDLASVDVHALLRSTEIVYIVVFSYLFAAQDRPSYLAGICACLVGVGAAFYSWGSIDSGAVQANALVINLVSSIASPFEILFTRKVTKFYRYKISDIHIYILFNFFFKKKSFENVYFKKCIVHVLNEKSVIRKEKNIPVLKSSEITGLKMLLSLLFIFPAALIYEKQTPWVQLNQVYGLSCNLLLLAFGIFLTLLYQWNTVALLAKIEPVIVGVASQAKSIGTYLLSLAIGGIFLHICHCTRQQQSSCSSGDTAYPQCPCFDPTTSQFYGSYAWEHIVGVVFIVLGIAMYSTLKYFNRHIQRLS